MREAERLAQRDFRGLRRWARRSVKLTDEFFRIVARSEVDGDDDMALVSLAFSARQANHLQAIARLGRSRDTQLIARSMIEGLHLLMWIQKQGGSEASRWREFGQVVDWRILRDRKARGEQIDEERLTKLEDTLSEKGAQYLSKFARTAESEEQPLPDDPYRREWSPHTFKDVCKDIDRTDKWATSYRSFCDWHHWNPAGVLPAVLRDSSSFRYMPNDTLKAAESIANGIECLVGTLEIADSVLSLGFHARLAQHTEKYIAWSNREGWRSRGVGLLMRPWLSLRRRLGH